jgi:alanine dehydrogenase
MIIGVPREIKDSEARVGVTPAGVKTLAEGLNTWLGTLTCRSVGKSQQRTWAAAASVIE